MSLIKYEIDAHRDFELGNTPSRKVEYSIFVPEKNIKGLVVLISGFGGDGSKQYREKFQKHIADIYSMACLAVDYHCFFSRPNNGGTISIDPKVMLVLRSITGCKNNESIDTVLKETNRIRTNVKTPLEIPATIYPGKNEYQNLGILPALDVIYAINDVFKKFELPKKTYAIGSSYGGHIANLVSKFAPSTLNAVFDNSSWASPPFNYCIGNEINKPEFLMNYSKNIILKLNVLSQWSSIAFMPNAYNNDRALIRSFPEDHIEIMSKAGNQKTIYRFVHQEKDNIANTNEKISFVALLNKKGFNATIKTFSDKDIDGEYIKTAEHGMGLSLRKFFAKYYNETVNELHCNQTIDFDFEHRLNFKCETEIYSITYDGCSQPICDISSMI